MDSKVNIELMIAKDILDAICSGWIRYLNGDKRDYNETLNRIYKIITTCTNKSIEEKPMEKKYRVIKEFPTVSGFTRIGDIWKYHPGIKKYIDKNGLEYEIDLIENNPKWFKEVKEWGKLESILTDFALRIQGEYGNPDYNFLDDVCEISNKISKLQKEIK